MTIEEYKILVDQLKNNSSQDNLLIDNLRSHLESTNRCCESLAKELTRIGKENDRLRDYIITLIYDCKNIEKLIERVYKVECYRESFYYTFDKTKEFNTREEAEQYINKCIADVCSDEDYNYYPRRGFGVIEIHKNKE